MNWSLTNCELHLLQPILTPLAQSNQANRASVSYFREKKMVHYFAVVLSFFLSQMIISKAALFESFQPVSFLIGCLWISTFQLIFLFPAFECVQTAPPWTNPSQTPGKLTNANLQKFSEVDIDDMV